MTTGRMMTALGALALGLATAGAVPALAQQSGSANTTAPSSSTAATSAAPSHANTGTTATNTAQAPGTGGQMNSATGPAHNPAAATTEANTEAGTSTAPGNSPVTTGHANATTSTKAHAQNAPQHMNPSSRSATMTHHPMEHRRVATRRSTNISNANPNAQNAEVARLNEQSLQAAQQGKAFTPSSNM